MRQSLFTFAFLLLPSLVLAAPTFDARTLKEDSSITSTSFSHTVGCADTNNIVLVTSAVITNTSSDVSSITVDGNAATSITSVSMGVDGMKLEAWYRKGVAVGSAKTVTVNYSSNDNIVSVSARSYCGVDQTTPLGTAVTNSSTGAGATSLSVSVTSATGELVVDFIQITNTDGTLAQGAGQTQRTKDLASTFFTLGESDAAGAGSVTMQWTQTNGDDMAMIGVSLKPVVAAPTTIRHKVASQ